MQEHRDVICREAERRGGLRRRELLEHAQRHDVPVHVVQPGHATHELLDGLAVRDGGLRIVARGGPPSAERLALGPLAWERPVPEQNANLGAGARMLR